MNVDQLLLLATELEPWFDKPFAELPLTLQRQVNSSWDEQDETQRRAAFADYFNYNNQPTSEADLKIAAAFQIRLLAAQRDVEKWERVGTPTATDLKLQADELAIHRKKLKKLKKKRDRGDYLTPICDDGRSLINPSAPSSTKHVLNNRSVVLAAEIDLAMGEAVDRDAPRSVWAALVHLAEKKTGSLIGFCSEDIQYQGKKYQDSGDFDVFKIRHLRARMARAKARRRG